MKVLPFLNPEEGSGGGYAHPLPLIRISKSDGSEEITDTDRALSLLTDVYGNRDDVIEMLRAGRRLQTDFAFYEMQR